MKGDSFGQSRLLLAGQRSLRQVRCQNLCIMENLEATTQFRIFIFKGVVAMGGEGNNLGYPMLIEGLYILLGQILEELCLAQGIGFVSIRTFFGSQNPKGDIQMLEQVGY